MSTLLYRTKTAWVLLRRPGYCNLRQLCLALPAKHAQGQEGQKVESFTHTIEHQDSPTMGQPQSQETVVDMLSVWAHNEGHPNHNQVVELVVRLVLHQPRCTPQPPHHGEQGV